MGDGSMLRGEVLDVKGHDYLVRLADGSTRLLYTDNRTFGNGPARPGEAVLACLENDDRISVLTRVLWIPLTSKVSIQSKASVTSTMAR
ncbi:MAG: hypothetical protein NPIRA05_22140 [Nitrospirales bacterium]|nr:MAG: hypothetical protein NPIRA05_22140 [Nitrospirales bacterium]